LPPLLPGEAQCLARGCHIVDALGSGTGAIQTQFPFLL
jgi:hypothetical protein